MSAASGSRPGARRAPRRSGRGTLAVIAALLIGSALLRLGADAGQALARAPESPDDAAGGDGCTPPPDVARVLDALAEREVRLDTRAEEIDARTQALAVADAEIDRRMAELEEAEATLRATIADAETAAEDDLTRLTEVYESMKPKEAVPLFEAMTPEFAAGFLGRMRPEAAAGILAGMTPDSAYAVSALLAGRNFEVPTR